MNIENVRRTQDFVAKILISGKKLHNYINFAFFIIYSFEFPLREK